MLLLGEKREKTANKDALFYDDQWFPKMSLD